MYAVLSHNDNLPFVVVVRTVEVRACFDRPLILSSPRRATNNNHHARRCLFGVCLLRAAIISSGDRGGRHPQKSAFCRGAVVLRKFCGDLMGMGPSHGSA
jgi:hypothetical protein